MPTLTILNQAKGPLPIKATFNAPSDGPTCLVLSGSVWAQSASQLIGIQLELDGKVVGSASIFSNGPSTHRAVVPSYIPVTLTFGQHTVALLPLNAATTSDNNDFFSLILHP
jgi:hypothetical protein